MGKGNQVWAEAITDTFTDSYYAQRLGEKRLQIASEVAAGIGSTAGTAFEGERTWTFVYNDDAVVFAEGHVIIIDTSSRNEYDGILSVAVVSRGEVLGVAGFAVAVGSYAWIVSGGYCSCEGDGSVAAGESVVPHDGTGANAGQADTMAAGEEDSVFGSAMTADSGTPALFTCHVGLE